MSERPYGGLTVKPNSPTVIGPGILLTVSPAGGSSPKSDIPNVFDLLSRVGSK